MKKGLAFALSTLAGAALGAGAVEKMKRDRLDEVQELSGRHLALFLMMNQWVKVKQKGINLSLYFEKNNYKKIAIYGMSYVGETLLDELKGTGTEVAYGIDRNAESIYADVDIVTMSDDLQPVDAVVVTAITFYDEIEAQLSKRLDCPIISLEDMLQEF